MSSEALTWCWRQRGMKANHHHLLLALAEHAHPDGTSSYPSVARLALMTGYTERSIPRILGEMVEAGMIEVEVRAGWLKNGRSMPTSYRLPIFGSAPPEKIAPPAKMAARGVKSSTTPPEKIAPEPRTRTNNLNQEHSPAPAPPSSAVVDPAKVTADKIARMWWESLTPRPASGTFPGYRRCFEAVLRAGWPAEAVAAAARQCERTVTIARLELILAKSQARVGPWEGTAAGSTTRAVTADEFYGVKPSEGVHT